MRSLRAFWRCSVWHPPVWNAGYGWISVFQTLFQASSRLPPQSGDKIGLGGLRRMKAESNKEVKALKWYEVILIALAGMCLLAGFAFRAGILLDSDVEDWLKLILLFGR